MKRHLLFIVLIICCITIVKAQTAIWHSVDDSVLYTNVKVGINTSNPKEALDIREGFVRGSGGYGALRIKTDYGITAVGADSPGYSKFDTNLGLFYFTKPLVIQGGKISSSHGTNLYLQTLYYDGGAISPTTRMTILNSNGRVGIGTTSPSCKLDVVGKIHASDSVLASNIKISGNGVYSGQVSANSIKTNTISSTSPSASLSLQSDTVKIPGTIKTQEIIVNSTGADFVFDEDYTLRPLQEVKSFVSENHHLPEIPSAKQMQEEGMNMEQMVVKLLQKVEELTLYTIQQEEQIKELEKIKSKETEE